MTAVEAEAGRLKEETDEPGWEVDPDDEWGVAVITTVGRQLKLRREAAGLRAAEFGRIVGYGEDMVYKIEGGKRIPRQEFLDKADEILNAGGLIAAAWEDVKKVRIRRRFGRWGSWKARRLRSGCTSATASTACCRRGTMREHCSRPVSRRTRLTTWNAWWPLAWTGSPCSSEIPPLRFTSCWKRRLCDARSGAQWCGTDSSNACWRWGGCGTSRFR